MEKKEDALSREIIGSAIEVHRCLGPGLLESVYQRCLAYELQNAGIAAQRELALPVHYKNLEIHAACRLDILVEQCVIVEVKAVESALPVHRAQLLSYLRLSELKLGLLINFNVPILKAGITRVVNQL